MPRYFTVAKEPEHQMAPAQAVLKFLNFCAQWRSDVGFEKEDWRRMIQEDSGYLNWDGEISSVFSEQHDKF
jgi:hypothetical protein